MSDYTKTVNFAAKDALLSGDPNKTVVGTELNSEFAAIHVAVATKLNSNNGVLTGTTVANIINAQQYLLDGADFNTTISDSVTAAELAETNAAASETAAGISETNAA